MATAAAKAAMSSSGTDYHRMRISSAGSISSYVRFALSFLQTNPGRSLILHTLPPDDSNAPEISVPIPTNAVTDLPNSTADRSKTPSSTLTPSLLTTPKLISVVEIIKREYINLLNDPKDSKGKNRATGLWQYTETGQLPIPVHVRGEGMELARVLEGKTKPKMTHNLFLQITLSTKPLGLEEGIGMTCQYVLAARRRGHGKNKKGLEGGDEIADVDNAAEGEEAVANNGLEVEKAGRGKEERVKKRKVGASQESRGSKKRAKAQTAGQR